VEITEADLRALAGDCARRVAAFARQHNIPLERCAIGDRTKHARAAQARPADPDFQGVFRIMVSRAPALVWRVWKNKAGKVLIRRPKQWPLVNHYHFHLIDREWGHVTVRLSGHPPFNVQVNVNGQYASYQTPATDS
jgi:hypothetical protein